MGIEDNSTHDGYNGYLTQPMMGIEVLQWKYNLTHDGDRRYTMGI